MKNKLKKYLKEWGKKFLKERNTKICKYGQSMNMIP